MKKLTNIRDGIELLITLRNHLHEQATAAWVVSDYPAEGNFSAKAAGVQQAIEHLNDATKID